MRRIQPGRSASRRATVIEPAAFKFLDSASFLECRGQVTPERFSSGVVVLGEKDSGVLWIADGWERPRETPNATAVDTGS